MYEIEKDVPVPPPRAETTVYPLKVMEIGDSFFVPFEGSKAMRRRLQSSISAKASAYDPKKFTTRSEEGGVRVWRIE